MGNIHYIIGASGCGKDSIINGLRKQLNGRYLIHFAHRYISRPAELGGENYIALSESEFRSRCEANLFAMHWHSNGLLYGIGLEINEWMQRGLDVVVNGSREYLPLASQLYPEMQVYWIQVEPQILQERLKKRGRETEEEIAARMKKANSFAIVHPNLTIIDNNTSLEQAIEKTKTHLLQHRSAQVQPS